MAGDMNNEADKSEHEENGGSSLKAEQRQPDVSLERGISSPKHSPPVQTMGEASGYDPNRIPAFVFTNKPATHVEWSVASSESLFSIHPGNNSFSKDLPILLAKSQELTKSGEVACFPARMAPVTEAADTEKETLHTRNVSGGIKVPTDELGVISIGAEEEKRKQNVPPSEETHKSASCVDSDGLAGEGLKVYLEKVELDSDKESNLQPQTPEPVSNTTESTWYSYFCCFSSRPFCC